MRWFLVAPSESDIDLEVTEESDEEEGEPVEARFEITSFPADYTVRVMYEKWKQKQLIIPEFQRRYVWNLPQASRLIESFLLGLPIPQVFLYRERTSPKLLVIDGHQRLGTIARFYDEDFDEKRKFRLTGVSSRWNGLTYSELPENDQIALDDMPLRSIVIQQTDPDDDSSVYQIFERLNTGGTQLNAMEIRKALYHTRAYPLLERISRSDAWWALLGLQSEDRRLKEIELLLRVLALTDTWESYVKPMKTWLTKHMARLEKTPETELSVYEERVAQRLTEIHAALGDRPFHLRSRLNAAALDSVVATLLRAPQLPENLAERYADLRSEERFEQTTAQDTSDATVLKERFALVQERLLG
ncbi:MAG: DUF262 domain-containing protein [Myxococcales bacterium]|nr:DUF262 domain-containing protein [Myxococcales bacterium]